VRSIAQRIARLEAQIPSPPGREWAEVDPMEYRERAIGSVLARLEQHIRDTHGPPVGDVDPLVAALVIRETKRVMKSQRRPHPLGQNPNTRWVRPAGSRPRFYVRRERLARLPSLAEAEELRRKLARWRKAEAELCAQENAFPRAQRTQGARP